MLQSIQPVPASSRLNKADTNSLCFIAQQSSRGSLLLLDCIEPRASAFASSRRLLHTMSYSTLSPRHMQNPASSCLFLHNLLVITVHRWLPSSHLSQHSVLFFQASNPPLVWHTLLLSRLHSLSYILANSL